MKVTKLQKVLAALTALIVCVALMAGCGGEKKKFVNIATGGTAEAAIKLIESLGGVVVKALFLMELKGLNGRDKLKGYDVDCVISYEGK